MTSPPPPPDEGSQKTIKVPRLERAKLRRLARPTAEAGTPDAPAHRATVALVQAVERLVYAIYLLIAAIVIVGLWMIAH